MEILYVFAQKRFPSQFYLKKESPVIFTYSASSAVSAVSAFSSAVSAVSAFSASLLSASSTSSEAAKTYVNVIAVKEGNEDSEKIQALVDVLKSDEIKDFINEKYDGAVIPFEESSDAEETDTEDADDADSKDADNADDTAEENADTTDTAEDAE